MASKLNTEFNYRYLVQGETPWAKIKTLKDFLEGRKRAAVLEEVGKKKYLAKCAELANARNIRALPHTILTLEAEILEMDSFAPAQKEAFKLNQEEIKILEKLLKEEYAKAEPTRIPGYSDEQMFEANAVHEFTMTIGKEIYAEIMATGRPSPAKLHNAMSNPHTFKALQDAGLIMKTIPYLTMEYAPGKLTNDSLRLPQINIYQEPKALDVKLD